MSIISIQTSPMSFSKSFGNYLPPEYEDFLTCDYCYDDDTELSINDMLYNIPWRSDFHICENCINDFLDDEGGDLGYVCPICDISLNDKETFTAHMLKEHLELGGI